MKEEIKQFLQTSLLEEYVLGVIDPNKIPEVEEYIKTSPEVQKAYEDLQNSIAQLAKKMEILPPEGTKGNILRQIDNTIDSTSSSPSNYHKWWAIAASLALLALGFWSFNQQNQKATLQAELNNLQSQYSQLKDQCSEKDLLIAKQEEQWNLLSDPNTQKHILAGNEKAPDWESVAYWNEKNQSSYLQIVSLPELPKGKCLQLWADVDGEMISLNVIPTKVGELLSIPFKNNATSLNVTIEPDGGSDHPTVADLVASVAI